MIALGVLLGAGRVAGEILSVANPHLQLAVDRAIGQWIEFRVRATAHILLGGNTATGPLWELELAGAGPLTSTNARSVTVTPLRGKLRGCGGNGAGLVSRNLRS